MNQKEVFKKVKRATVALGLVDFDNKKRPYEIIGSGFCIDASGIIVTCAHVINAFMAKSIPEQIAQAEADPRNKGKADKMGVVEGAYFYAVFYAPEESSTRLITFPTPMECCVANANRDIGLVKVSSKHEYFQSGFPFLEVEDYENLDEGLEIGICGFPLGTHLMDELGTVTSSFTKGMISSIIPSPGVPVTNLGGFQLDVTATHGNSGGPVFSVESGKVFGILSQGVGNLAGQIVPGFVKAEPVYPVLDAVARLKSEDEAQFDQMAKDFLKLGA